MSDLMEFPETVEEFMEEYKTVDTEQVYSNGTEYVPIFRMKQWFQTHKAIPVEWIEEWHNRHEWKYESYFTMRDGKPKYAIECMVEDWEKENE